MKQTKLKVTILLALALAACNNVYHNLIPPDENRIITFELPGQLETEDISDESINITVAQGALSGVVIPHITISHKATLLPLTYEYLTAAFPNAEMPKAAAAIYQTPDINEYILDLVKNDPGFNVPAVEIPIDFSGPVGFLVVSGQGTIRQYTAIIKEDDGKPRLLSLGFSKYDNPELMKDAVVKINEASKTVKISFLYPVEIPLSYALVPSFEILGDALEVDGNKIKSGETEIQFAKMLGRQEKTITIWRNGMALDYLMEAAFEEDPDSVRSITDFRFTKSDNPGIAVNAMGTIINNDELGTITVQVFYSGARPNNLVPRFISPGNVYVDGITQYTGESPHDFSGILEYQVISRNNYFVRTYTVRVELIDIAAASPTITAFSFSSNLNPELVQDSTAEISDAAGLILVVVRYGGSTPPEFLAPNFSATGLVSVMGIVQSSGYSSQDFSRQVKYTVYNPENSLFSRDYWVQTTFIRDTSSAAGINSFSFHPADNPGLEDELKGRIDHNAGTIIINAPSGSGVSSRTMFPRFSADGQVSVNGSVQVSGASGHLFDPPVMYTAVSANGTNRRNYTVTVRELSSTIYVDGKATGRSDGTDWQNAFRSLLHASEAAAEFPEDIPVEVWIAAGTYSDSIIPVTPNTSYIGGFAGNETAKSARNVNANTVRITGLFDGSAGVPGDLSFEQLYLSGRGISVENISGDVNMNNLEFKDITRAVSIKNIGGEVDINNLDLRNINSGAIFISGSNGRIRIENLNMQDILGDAVSIIDANGNVDITSLDMKNITGRGIYLNDQNGGKSFSRITGRNISGNVIHVGDGGSGLLLDMEDFDNMEDYWDYLLNYDPRAKAVAGSFTLADSTFDSCGSVYQSQSSSSTVTTTVRNTTITNSRAQGSRQALRLSAGKGNITATVTINGVPNAGAFYASTSGAVRISNSSFRNSYASSGAGIYISGSASAEISGTTTVENVQSTNSGGGIYVSSATVRIIGSTVVRNTKAGSSGGAIYLSGTGNKEISGLVIEDTEAADGGGIYASGGGLTITNSSIRRTKAARGGAIYIDSPGNSDLGNVTIEDTQAEDSGGGVYASGGGRLTVRNCPPFRRISAGFSGGVFYASSTGVEIYNATIENSKVVDQGGGIYVSGGSLLLRDSTIRNTYANCGGGIFMLNSTGVEIYNSTIENAEAWLGGGVYNFSNSSFIISGSRFENCITLISGGAVYTPSVNCSVTNTDFINCAAGQGTKIFYGEGSFRRCNFTDTDALHKYPKPNMYHPMFKIGKLDFDTCTFNRLRDDGSSESFIFNRISDRSSGGWFSGSTTYLQRDGYDLNIKNCTFNFYRDCAGLMYMTARSGDYAHSDGEFESDYVYMENCTINNGDPASPGTANTSNCILPLFKFYHSAASSKNRFTFKNNNYFGLWVVRETQGVTTTWETGSLSAFGEKEEASPFSPTRPSVTFND